MTVDKRFSALYNNNRCVRGVFLDNAAVNIKMKKENEYVNLYAKG